MEVEKEVKMENGDRRLWHLRHQKAQLFCTEVELGAGEVVSIPLCGSAGPRDIDVFSD